MIKPAEFIHPEDASAMHNLNNIPGFVTLSKKVMEHGYENYRYGLHMASTIRLSTTQLPHLYNKLPPLCRKLGMQIPEFYLEMKNKPNAAASGIKRTYIRITSGAYEYMNDEEINALLAHECGHIVCRHNLYRILIEYIRDFTKEFDLIPKPIIHALMYWYRKSELSSDRCAALLTSPDAVVRMISHFAGGPESIIKDLNIEEWIIQTNKYEMLTKETCNDKALQWIAVMERTHPFNATRVTEIMKWGKTEEYKKLKAKIFENSNKICYNCNNFIGDDWAYCKQCGTKL